MRKELLVFFVLVMFLASTLFMPVKADDVVEVVDYYWGEDGVKWAAMPGDVDVKLTIVLQNMEDTTVCGLRATIASRGDEKPFPFRDKDGNPFITSYLDGSIPVGASKALEFEVSIDPDAEPGFYEVNLHLSYLDCEDPDYPKTSTLHTLTLKVWEEPDIDVVNSEWVELDGSQTYAGPGDTAKLLSLTFHVPRYYTASDIQVVLHLNEYFENLTGGNIVREFYRGEVPEGGSFTLQFPLNIAEDAPIGTHTLEATLTYYDRWLVKRVQVVEVPVRVSGSGDVEVRYEGVSMPAGASRRVEILVENVGTAPIYSVEAELSASTGLMVVSGSSEKWDALAPGESASFKPLVMAPPTTKEGTYILSLRLEYKDSAGREKSESKEISVYVRPAPEVGLTAMLSGGPLTASESNEVKLVLRNLYDGPVSEVKTLLSLKGLPMAIVGGEPNAYFPEIPAGGSAETELQLLVSPQAEETVYEAELLVDYRDPSGQPRTDTLPVSIVVRGALRLSFRDIQIASSLIKPGAAVDIVGEILNSGTVTARLTEVKLILEPPLIETPDSKYYIGDVTSYSTSSFTVSFEVSPDAEPGKYPVKLVATCENSYGEKITISKVIEVEIGEVPPQIQVEGETSQPLPTETLTLVGVAAIAAAILGALWTRRRRRKIEVS